MEQFYFNHHLRKGDTLTQLKEFSDKLSLLQRLAQNPGEPYHCNWLSSALPEYINYLTTIATSNQEDATVKLRAGQLKNEFEKVLFIYNQCKPCIEE